MESSIDACFNSRVGFSTGNFFCATFMALVRSIDFIAGSGNQNAFAFSRISEDLNNSLTVKAEKIRMNDHDLQNFDRVCEAV